ncbi:unnamed protein product [Scytosiphon promiscuus]
MGNPFSCCHPGRKEVGQAGRKDRDPLLQDSSTQTPAGGSSGFGSTPSPPNKADERSRGTAADNPPSGSTERIAYSSVHSSSSSSGGGGGSSNGALRAAPAAIDADQQRSAVGSGAGGQCSAAGGMRGNPAAAAAPAVAAMGTAAAGGHGDVARGSGGVAARAHPVGLSAGANGLAAPAPAYRSAGAMPRAHPNDQHRRNQQLAVGGAHAGDTRMGGRGAAQQYGAASGAGAVARGGGRFGTTALAASARGGGGGAAGIVGKTVARSVPAAAGTVLAKYELKEVLGIGSTSKCYRCVNRRNKKQFACKVIDKRAMDPKLKPLLDQFHVEIQVLQLLRHPNIIHMEDVFESDSKIHMVMEIMQGGELFDYVVEKGTLSESEASVMVRKVTSALAYMHSLNIIHRDLKPENLLLTSKGSAPEVKIIDFGLAKVLGAEEDNAQSFLGTRGYLAPEMLQREAYNKEVDVWALGVIVFVLLCGCLPFDDDSKKLNRAGAFQKFVLRFPRWAQKLSPGAKDLLSKLLTVTPRARLTAEQALQHSWVTGKAAAADHFLESPRTLRKLRVNSPKKGWGGGGGGGGAKAPRQSAAGAAAAAAEAHRRAEFEEQTDEYREGGVGLGGSSRPRRKNSF